MTVTNGNGRVALVTGAGKRLGRAMALALGADGFGVVLHYNRSEDEARDAADAIRKKGGKAITMSANLSVEGETEKLIGEASAAAGPISLLVNSASLFNQDDIETMTRDSWDAHMETNLRAPLKLAQEFARQAPGQAENNGVDNLVVNMIDQRVYKLTPQFLSYTLSKSALLTLTKTLAQSLGPKGIRVNAIGPGPTIRNARQSEADFRAQSGATILGRGATPDDIVGALRYFVSAPAVTGQMIAVDGGQHLAWRTPDVLVSE